MDIKGRMKVKTLKEQFKKEFGLTLRLYDGRSFADDDSTLASIRKGDAKGGELNIRANMKVGNFEDKLKEEYGIKSQVAGSDDSYLCDNDLTLKGALDKDVKRKTRGGAKDKDSSVQGAPASSGSGKRYFLELYGKGGEYTAGFVSDAWAWDHQDEDAILECLDNIENYMGEVKSHFEIDDVIHMFGAHYDESRVEVKDESGALLETIDLSELDDNNIQIAAPYYDGLEEMKSENILNVISHEKGYFGKYELLLEEEFDSKRLLLTTADLEESIGGDTSVIEMFVYVPTPTASIDELVDFIVDTVPAELQDDEMYKLGTEYSEAREKWFTENSCIVLKKIEDHSTEGKGMSASISSVEPNFED